MKHISCGNIIFSFHLDEAFYCYFVIPFIKYKSYDWSSVYSEIKAFLNKCLINHVILWECIWRVWYYILTMLVNWVCVISKWVNNLCKFKTSTLPWYLFIYPLVHTPKTLSSLWWKNCSNIFVNFRSSRRNLKIVIENMCCEYT